MLDTNIISELRKGEGGDPAVRAWLDSTMEDELFTSVLVLGELRKGVERLRRRNPAKAEALDGWYAKIKASFGDRALGVAPGVAELWGRLNGVRDLPVVDSLLAATAIVHGLTLVTRNEADVAGLGLRLLNPFNYVPA